MSNLNLAVIGLAHGWKFVDAAMEMEGVNLMALCGQKERGATVRGVPYYQGYKELLKDLGSELDGIVAAVPNDLHVEVTWEAAQINLPVLMEKPIANTVEEGKQIIDIVNKNNLKYVVGHHRRFSEKINLARSICEEGKLGRLIGANVLWASKKPDEYFERPWRVQKGVGGPLLINVIHDVDDLRYIIGEIEAVQGRVTNEFRGNDVEDAGIANFIFKNGAMATLFMTDASPSIWFYEACAQEDPAFHPSDKDCYYFFGDKGSLAFPNMELITYNPEAGEGWMKPYQRYQYPVKRVNPIVEETRHFCSVIKGEAESKVTAEDATRTLEIVKAIEESSRTGKMINL